MPVRNLCSSVLKPQTILLCLISLDLALIVHLLKISKQNIGADVRLLGTLLEHSLESGQRGP